MMVEDVNKDGETVRKILIVYLGLRKVSANVVLPIYSGDQKQHWLYVCFELSCFLANGRILDIVSMGDDTW
jgi:hypothetical protein